MFLIYMVVFISLATIVSVLVWFALEDRTLNCSNNGCTQNCNQGRDCHCGPNTEADRKVSLKDDFSWPFPHHRP